jgi:outer membrane protein assembly factor BamB
VVAGPPYRRRVVLLSSLVLGIALLAPSVATATSTDQAVAYQLDPAHDGDQTGNPITAPLSQAWSINLPGSISYPLIVNGVVYVTAGSAADGNGTTLYALDQATGTTLWSHPLGGLYAWSGLSYDAGQVFTVNYSGTLTAFNAATGATVWSRALPGQSAFTSPPTAADGYVYTGGAGSGGTLYAVSEATGQLAWTAPVENGDHSSPAVDSSGVYVTYAADQDYAFNPFSGALLWHHQTGSEGGGGKTPVLAAGNIFGRDAIRGNVVLPASGGPSLGTFASTTAPAVGGGQAYLLSGGALNAVNGSGLGTTAWTFNGDGKLDSAPLLVGNLVFEGSSSGEVYAVNSTGTSVWSANAGSAIPAPDEQNVSQPLTGLGAGEGTLIVPAGGTLVAYAGANIGTGTPANTSAPTIIGAPAIGQAIGADVGTWTALPTGYAYQWSRCDANGALCVSVDGATAESYTPTSADIGSTLELTVMATNGSGTSTAVDSAASSVVLPPIPANMTPPTIAGIAIQGQTLAASPGTWTQTPTGYGYQWLDCRQGSCAIEPGATSSSYLVAPSDIGAQIEVRVTATNAGGTSPAMTSIPTAATSMPAATTLTPALPSLTAPVGPLSNPPAFTPESDPTNTVPVASRSPWRPMTVAVLAKLRTILLHQAKVGGDPRPTRARVVATSSHAAESLLTAGSHHGQPSTPAYLVCASGTFDASGISVPPSAHPRHGAATTLCLVVLRHGLRVTELSLGQRYPDLRELGAVEQVALAPAP